MDGELFIDTQSGQVGLFEEREEYDAFLDKFKAKKTTDDCYTPENVFAAVSTWVAREYSVDPASFVRPFWPGGDFLRFDYPDGCVVVDNPPFSLRAQIVDFYMAKGIRFFLFSPALTLLTHRPLCHIAIGVTITYENGAEVATSFVTNLEPCALRTAPELYEIIERENDANLALSRKILPKYEYPDHVITAAIAQRWCHYGVEYRLDPADCVPIRALDAQKDKGKAIFGSGYLLSERAAAERAAAERAAAERAAAERAAAERAAAEKWKLSEREKAIVAGLEKEKEKDEEKVYT